MEAVECGAAALGIILSYFGRVVPLAELRQRCGVSRDGSKASNMVKAARMYGLQAKGFSKSIEAAKAIACPFIVFWQFNHFVVVEGFSRDHVYLNDPAMGHRRVTSEEFDEGFTGVVLVMEPGDAFKRGGRQPSAAAGLWRRMRGNLQALLLIAAAGFLSVLPGLAIPTMAAVYLDSVVIEGRYDWFRPLIIAMIATLALKLVLQAVQQTYIRRLRLGLIARMNSQFFWHLLRLPAGFYTQRFPGEIVNRMELNYKLAQVVAGPLASTTIDLLTMVIYGVVLLMFNVPLTLIATALAVFNLLYLRRIGKRRIESNMRYSQTTGKLDGFTIAGIQSIETMKASGMEDDFFTKWMGYYAKSSNAGQELQKSSQLVEIIPPSVDMVTSVLILIIGGYYVIHGQMTIGTLVAFQGLMTSYLAPVASITKLGSTLQELRGDLIRLDDVLANPKVDDGQTANADQPASHITATSSKLRLEGELELKDVTFGYSPLEPPLIEGLSFRVRPGERVALVGGSGSGKSTIARLICGLYEPWSGEIMLDGYPRRTWPEHILSQSLGMVEQQIMLFEGTVRDNLTLWDKTISDHALERAAQDANIDDVIRDLPGTFSAELNEGGTNLSGGQRQRLEIARALVCDPAVLVLDEATSALDSETEAIIDANFRRRGCSCVIVAHRLSTIRDCNEIIVLDRGKVVERGTHEQLWQAGGHYAALLRYQDTVENAS
jgi:NHLM bacteriocin system ABC transporter peptidase/ATP-binding protein